MSDLMEVCPLSGGVMLNLGFAALNAYSTHYKRAFAFSIFLYPQPHQRPLRLAFPSG